MINEFKALYRKEIESFNVIINGYNYKVVMQDLPLHNGADMLTSTFNEDDLTITISRHNISCSYAMYSFLYEVLYLILMRNGISTISTEYMRDTLVPQLNLAIFGFLNSNFFKIEQEENYRFDKCNFLVSDNKLNIGGFIYNIIYTDEELFNKYTGEKCYGVTYNLESEIQISTKYAEQLVNITLIHEILHALIHSRGIELEVEPEESLVEHLSHELNMFLKCNRLVISK